MKKIHDDYDEPKYTGEASGDLLPFTLIVVVLVVIFLIFS